MRVEDMSKEARRLLIKNAIDSTWYVALGQVLKRDLAQQFQVPEHVVEQVLAAIARNLNDTISRL
jgi:succinyl-CoA synthetase beta subunit